MPADHETGQPPTLPAGEDLPAEAVELGAITGAYTVSPIRSALYALMGLAVFLAGVFMVALTGALIHDLLGQGRLLIQILPQMGWLPALPVALVFGLHYLGLLLVASFGVMLMVHGVAVPWRFYRARGLRVFVGERGLLRWSRGQVEFLRWEGVAIVRRVAPRHRWSVWLGKHPLVPPLRVEPLPGEGPPVQFDESLSRFSQLRRQIEAATLPHLVSAVLQHLRAGEAVDFGSLMATSEGLTTARGLLPWEELKGAEVRQGKLILRARRRWTAWWVMPVTRVPNAHVLLAFARAIPRLSQAS